VTENDEAPDSPAATQGVLTVGTSEPGEVLADRYQLDQHINDDAYGRQIWLGSDVLLRRPVAIIVRHPGGDSAGEMLAAAVSASRLTHPHLVDVYDAVDEGNRAYVVREWVDGTSLRDLVADGPLDPVRATAIVHAVADAVAAAHAIGMVHGNIHPGTVLIADDGRVVLSDARADEHASAEQDVRNLGALLYCALTGHWPHAEAGEDRIPDAMRDQTGQLAAPRQMRAGIPAYISDLDTRVLDLSQQPPSADQFAYELSRLDTQANDEFFSDGPLGFGGGSGGRESGGRGRSGRKLLVGVAALLVIAVGGILLADKIGGNSPSGQTQNAGVGTGTATAPTGTASGQPVHQVQQVPLTPDSIRMIETGGDGADLGNTNKIVDGDENTYWKSNWYRSALFGNLKSGMGLLINLGSVKNVTSVQVDFLTPDEKVQALVGSSDPGPGIANAKKIVQTYKPVGNLTPQDAGSTQVFPIGESTQYVLIWVTKLPPSDGYGPAGTYLFGINEVKVYAQ